MAKILRRHAVLEKVGFSNPTLKRLENAGQFPARIQIGPNSVGWIEEEIDDWIASRQRGTLVLASNLPKRSEQPAA